MNIFQKLITQPVEEFIYKVIQFLPSLFSSIFLLIIGMVVAWIMKTVLARLFRFLKLDEVSERSGISKVIARGGIREPFSTLLARFVGWVIVLAFVIIALNALNVLAIERLFEKFFLYLPNVFVALLIVIFGAILGNFFGRAALIASVNAGLKISGLIGKGVKLAIFLFSISIALEQLGIGKDTVIISFSIIFGGIVFALSLAFGLGGKDIAKDYLEKRIRGEEQKDEISHL
ncbi:MAG: hypothetical protein P8Z71_04985 [Candidatus Sulfobium sp.]|jgi:Mechanosensitive ion channel, conserved TM helix